MERNEILPPQNDIKNSKDALCIENDEKVKENPASTFRNGFECCVDVS